MARPGRTLNADEWNAYIDRPDVFFATTFIVKTSGTSVTLPADWNPSANTITGIGAGGGGAPNPFGCSSGGGGGGCSVISNFSSPAGTVVPITVGTGATTFDNSSTLVAAAGGIGWGRVWRSRRHRRAVVGRHRHDQVLRG